MKTGTNVIVTAADVRKCANALQAIKKFGDHPKVRRYPSTRGSVDQATTAINKLKIWYSAHVGIVMYPGMPFPFTVQELNNARGATTVLWAYAYAQIGTRDKVDAWRKDVIKVTDLALARLAWIGKVK